MAQDISGGVRSAVDRMLEADVQRQISRRGREMASAVADATEAAAARAAEAWQESRPARREAARSARRYGKEAAKAWKKQVRPALGSAWKRRTVAIGAASAAVPAGKEVIDAAAVRLGLKRQEERHWTAFFIGLLLGAIAGAAVAMLTAPKPGSQMREELASKAREAGDWVPIFQREPATNGHPEASSTTSTVTSEGAEATTPAEPSAGEGQPS